MNFEEGFKKIMKNLDEKIAEINKMKKEVQSFKLPQEEEDDSRRSFSGDDPFS